MRPLQQIRKNKKPYVSYFVAAGLFALVLNSSLLAFWGSEAAIETKSSESGKYRVYYAQTGEAREVPDAGFGKFRRLDYKIVFDGDWKLNKSREIQIMFLDSEGYEILGDIRPDRDFAPRGEYYGAVWIKEGQWGKIKSVKVKEIFPYRKKRKPRKLIPANSSEPEGKSQAVVEKSEDNTPKGLFDFGKTVYTDDMIRKELEKRKIPLAAEEPQENNSDDEDLPDVTEPEIEEA